MIGSLMVFRKLKQNVEGFWKFMNSVGKELDMQPETLASKFIGRWKSGAPLSKFPLGDPNEPEKSDFNDFKYLKGEQAGAEIDDDKDGVKTPRFAHIRKVYPRDDGVSPNAADNLDDNRTHRILRRGIAYGPTREVNHDAERGLIFVCYQKDLSLQFEFLMKAWANNRTFPSVTPPVTPPFGHGIDAIIGKTFNTQPDGTVTHKDDEVDNLVESSSSGLTTRPIPPPGIQGLPGLKQWVFLRGGDYFFSPSLSALKDKLFTEP